MVCVGLGPASLSHASSCGSITKVYDKRIEASAERWWPVHVDWVWWKAQLWQESRLDPNAVSPVGATGIAQFMPGTWTEVQKALDYGIYSRRVVVPALYAGAYYMRKQANQWSSKRTEIDRWDLARASYNAGLGHLLSAQKLCMNKAPYADIIECLPDVTGRHSEETINYNIHIHKHYRRLKICP